MDCSPTNRERELGLNRRETGWIYPTLAESELNSLTKPSGGSAHTPKWRFPPSRAWSRVYRLVREEPLYRKAGVQGQW